MVDLDELMRLHTEATPGPWGVPFYTRVRSETERKEIASCEEDEVPLKQREKNAAYICAACNATPEMAQRIRELEEVVRTLGTWLANAYIDPCLLPDIGRNDIEPPQPEDVIAYAKECTHGKS